MIAINKDTVTFPRDTWEELKKDEYFRELIEIIEEREELLVAKEETEYFVDYDEYRKL